MNGAADVRICSDKLLAECQDELEGRTVYAVQCSSAPLKDADHGRLQHRIFSEFMDTAADRMDAFQPDQAEEIAAFVKDVPEGAVLFFCCDSGVSGSSALAAAYLRSRGRIDEEMEIWGDPDYHPNPLVYKLQCRAFGIRVTGPDVKRRIRINEAAFSRPFRRKKDPVRAIFEKIRTVLTGKGN